MLRFFNTFNLAFLIFSISIFAITAVAIHEVPVSILKNFDIVSFYTGGLILDRGEKVNLYDPHTQYMWQKTVTHQSQVYVKPFVNPPFVALFFAPFTRVSFSQAYSLFAFFNAGLFLIAVYFFIQEQSLLLQKNTYIFFFICTLFYMPIYETLLQGQLSFFLFSAIVFSWYGFKHHKPFHAGLALSIFLIKPYLLLYPFILLIWKKQWHALMGVIVSMSVFVSISIWLIGPRSCIGYLLFLIKAFSNPEKHRIFPETEPTLRGILQYISHTDSFTRISIPFMIGVLLVSVVFFLVWKGPWNVKSEKFAIQWAVLIIIMVLTSIHTYYYDLVLLLFPYIILLWSIRSRILLYCTGMGIDFLMLICFLLGPWQSFFSICTILLLGIFYMKMRKGKPSTILAISLSR